MADIQGHDVAKTGNKNSDSIHNKDSFVLEKNIFSNVFEKDIKRVYLYKKAERLAKAIHLILPGLKKSPALCARVENVSVCLVDASTQIPSEGQFAMYRELLALSSALSIAKTARLLSEMNVDIILRETHILLEEIAGYEDPHVSLDESPTLARLSKVSTNVREKKDASRTTVPISNVSPRTAINVSNPVKDKSGREEAILSFIQSKGPSYIKDISTVIKDISEKTIQRELQALIAKGQLKKTGERRWTVYSIA